MRPALKWLVGITTGLAVTALALVARASVISGRRRRRVSTVYVRNRVLHGPGGFTYQLTDDDLLWLGRAVLGEAGTRTRGGSAVAWAMAQYHALVLGSGGSRPKHRTLASLLRAYCQPINPMWASADASGCQRNPDACTPQLLARRASITNMSWESLPASVRQLVGSFAQGTLENPVPGATDWAASNWGSRSTIPLVNIGGNMFGVGRDRRLYSEA